VCDERSARQAYPDEHDQQGSSPDSEGRARPDRVGARAAGRCWHQRPWRGGGGAAGRGQRDAGAAAPTVARRAGGDAAGPVVRSTVGGDHARVARGRSAAV
ncbi:hypothetical protein LTR94_033035, partial [Friedmanniomyces endolithicus]